MAWEEPKTNWTPQDRINYKDYNRIKRNLTYLWQEAGKYGRSFNIEDMGVDITSYLQGWDYRYFNAFETNVDIINSHILKKNYGFKQTFYSNGPFIGYAELNRIESAIFDMRRTIEGIKAGRIRLAFRLGAPKGLCA